MNIPSCFPPLGRPLAWETRELQGLASVSLRLITGGSRFETWRAQSIKAQRRGAVDCTP